MNTKLNLNVYIHIDHDTFLEYPTTDDLINDIGEKEVYNYIGYFPANNNLTYKEFKESKEETAWTIAFIGENDRHDLEFFNTTLEVRRRIREIVKKAKGVEYITIFMNKSIVYF